MQYYKTIQCFSTIFLKVIQCYKTIQCAKQYNITKQYNDTKQYMLDGISHFILSYLACFLLDKTAILLYNNNISKFKKYTPYSQNVRWFFIHFIVNLYITIYGFDDLKYSLSHTSTCVFKNWTNGLDLYITVLTLHLYHIIHFKLNKMDWLHHISMAIISGPIILLYNKTCSSVIGLWFTSGFPGAIDYFVLWLVKMGLCTSYFEKKLYVYINVWLRSPGCIYAAVLQLPFLYNLDKYPKPEIVAKTWLTFILFWNGQFFMHTTLKDYYRKKVVRLQ